MFDVCRSGSRWQLVGAVNRVLRGYFSAALLCFCVASFIMTKRGCAAALPHIVADQSAGEFSRAQAGGFGFALARAPRDNREGCADVGVCQEGSRRTKPFRERAGPR